MVYPAFMSQHLVRDTFPARALCAEQTPSSYVPVPAQRTLLDRTHCDIRNPPKEPSPLVRCHRKQHHDCRHDGPGGRRVNQQGKTRNAPTRGSVGPVQGGLSRDDFRSRRIHAERQRRCAHGRRDDWFPMRLGLNAVLALDGFEVDPRWVLRAVVAVFWPREVPPVHGGSATIAEPLSTGSPPSGLGIPDTRRS